MKYTVEDIINIKKKLLDKNSYSIDDFRNIVRVLLSKEEGCPWDSVQTHDSITNCLIEESYEVVQAVRDDDKDNLREELGDVLFQIVMHSECARRMESFLLKML